MTVRVAARPCVTIAAAVLATAVSVRAQDQPSATNDDLVPMAPVAIDGAVLFHVRGVASYPAEARARAIADRITAVAADPSIGLDMVAVGEADGMVTVLAGDRPIMRVVDADATLEQVTPATLAVAHLVRVRQAIQEYRAARTGAALRRAAIATILAVALLALMAIVLLRSARWVDRLVQRRLETRIHSIGIQSFEVMRAERIWAAVRNGLFAARTAALLASAFVCFGFVLAQWPWTRGLASDLTGFVLAPLRVVGRGVVASIPSLVFLAVLFVLIRVTLRLIRLFFDALGHGTVAFANFEPEWAQPTYKIIRLAIIAFGLVVAYPYVPGSESDAFKGVSLFLGIVFSLGSSTAVSNLVAGYLMTYRRAFKVGDRVQVGTSIGEVIESRLQVTRLRSFKNEEIVIPNSQILSSEVINYSSLARTRGLILHTEVGIGYETPWRQVEAMLLDAAQRTPGLERESPAFVLVKRLGDFAVVYELNVFTRDVQTMPLAYAALHRHILDVFNEYGVQIMTPAYESDPETPKVVSRADWYAAPAPAPRP